MPEGKSNSRLPFALILCGGFFFFANNHMLTIAIPLYLDSLGASMTLIGYSSAAMGALAFAFRFVCPPLFRKVGFTRILFASHTFLCLITALLLIADHPVQVFLIRTVYGIPLALFPIYYLLLVRKVSKSSTQLVSYTSIAGYAMPLSLAVSPFIAEFLVTRYSFTAAYGAAFAASLLSLFCMLAGSALVHSNRELEALPAQERTKAGLPVRYPILCYVYLGIVDIIVLGFLPLYAVTVGHSFSWYFLLFASAMVLSQSLLRSRRVLEHSKAYLRIGYGALVLCLLVITMPKIGLVVSAVCFGLGFSLVETVTNAVVIGSMTSEKETSLINYQQISISIGRTLAPFLFGLAIDSFGYNLSFLVAGLLGFVMVAMVGRDKQAPNTQYRKTPV